MSDPVLLVGGLGSIGRRYQAILKFINIPYLVYDYDLPFDDGPACNGERNLSAIKFDKAIICTSTDSHIEYVHQLMHLGKGFLCEKPLTKIPEELDFAKQDYAGGFMVCNYKFITKIYGPDPKLFYNYYRTGQDGLLWDCSQILYLDPDCELLNTSPLWDFVVNGHPIPYRALELSYVQMLKEFLWNKGKNLWTLEDGVKMSQAVLNRRADDVVKIVREE